MMVFWAIMLFGALTIVVVGWLCIIWAHFGEFPGPGRR